MRDTGNVANALPYMECIWSMRIQNLGTLIRQGCVYPLSQFVVYNTFAAVPSLLFPE